MRVDGDVVRWWMGGWKRGWGRDGEGMDGGMHRRMELRGRDLTGGEGLL